MKTHRLHLLFRWLPALLLMFAMAISACSEPPTELIKKAEDALLSATSVSECAEKEYAEAEAMLNQAKALAEDGDYEEAAVKAGLAYELAETARKVGEANWEECQKKKNAALAGANSGAMPNKLEASMLKTVYFAYNESTLSEESKSVLQSNAELLRNFTDSHVTVEGHCDERGSTEYNIALGERRSQSVRKYLMQLGIEGNRIGILSWGEERPAATGSTEQALAQNRRAEFKIR